MLLPADVLPTLAVIDGSSLSSWDVMKRTIVWLALTAVIAVVILTNKREHVARVSQAVSANPMGVLLLGLGAQFALLPAALILSAALALTIIGILAIPFALLGVALLTIVLAALGLVGTLHMWGRGTRGTRMAAVTERGADLQALLTGLVTLALPWVVAAMLRPVSHLLSGIAFAIAIGITWLFMTAGLGAAIRTRAGMHAWNDPWGIRRTTPGAPPRSVHDNAPQWMTPTPITGVVAAKLPG